MPAEGVFPSSSTDASDLDFRIEYTDQAAPDPIGLNIITKTHQWMDGLATNGLVIRHRIQNESEDDLPEVFVSQRMDANVYLEQFSGFDDKVAWDADRGMISIFDSGENCGGATGLECLETYVGLMILDDGVFAKRSGIAPHTAAMWDWNEDPFRLEGADDQLFELMTGGIDTLLDNDLPVPTSEYRMLLTPEPLSIAAGEAVEVDRRWYARQNGCGLGLW